ncbi:MAG: 2,6-beta-D-fructofuranosidase [Prevotella sp.]
MKQKYYSFFILFLCLISPLSLIAGEIDFKITKQYLNFPISQRMDRKTMKLSVKGQQICMFVIRLAEDKPDYWVFQDVSAWKGKKVHLTFDGSNKALLQIQQSDTIFGQSKMYRETDRPQYHFTTRRGWINDPNGLVYFQGKYHLFYQHNPYERDWENMHWGHAVSSDLLHWEEWPDALHPDSLGTIFSGSAVIDYENTAGYQVGKKPAMIAFYTADKGDFERQCMAYSNDEGLTFTKYESNPVIDSHDKWQSHDTRDPKVFWYKPGNHWVLVLNERNGHSIYNSNDLKNWTFESHITGFWECPELFELPVDGDKNHTKWVIWGASGTYMTGDFDGKKFTPDSPKKFNLNGSAYAAQCYNNIPADDGRVIKVAWSRISFDDTPFNGMMLLPQEQTLRTTNSGLKLYSYPIKEVESLFTSVFNGKNMTMEEANKVLSAFQSNDMLHIKVTLQMTYATDAGLRYQGQRLIDYDMNGNRLHGEFYVPNQPGSLELTADVFVDKGSVEVYIDGGAFSYAFKRDEKSQNKEGYMLYGNQLRIKNLEIFKANSIWK